LSKNNQDGSVKKKPIVGIALVPDLIEFIRLHNMLPSQKGLQKGLQNGLSALQGPTAAQAYYCRR
jgi:hypothetical protein